MADDGFASASPGLRLPSWPRPDAPRAGSFESIAADGSVSGWVIDGSDPGEPLELELVCGGRIVARGSTTIPRPDVTSLLTGVGAPGFRITADTVDLTQLSESANEDPYAAVEVYVSSCGAYLQKHGKNLLLHGIHAKDFLELVRSAELLRSAAPLKIVDATAKPDPPERKEGPMLPEVGVEDEVAAILREQPAARVVPRQSAELSVAGRASDAARGFLGTPPAELRNRLLVDRSRAGGQPSHLRHAVDAVVVARGGGVMVVGWIDDVACPVEAVTVSCAGWRIVFDATTLIRVRRSDAENALQSGPTHLFGFFGLVAAPTLEATEDRAQVDVQLANGGHVASEVTTRVVAPIELRSVALGYLAAAKFFGNPHVEAVASLDPGMGAQLLALNDAITKRVKAARHLERFGAPRRQPIGSIIVCLYGRAEFLFVQNALFAGLPGMDDYEFIFVSNSPEIAEELLREARLAHRIYGLNQSVVLLPGNAGFGAANNVGVGAALGRRILNVNPDVFPRQQDWARRHTELVEALPAEQTKLFGAALYYDDGSLMHGGMYFELDTVASLQGGAFEGRRMLRVEHYGKGAPDWATTYSQARPVPAVTGAFMSCDRAWYERLGGFTEDYVFGHYEDADLCLKSLEQGTPSWLHDLRLWHLEGKGSTRRPHHEGGSLVNRWHFTKRWLPMVSAGLLGPEPTHTAFARGSSMAVPQLVAPPQSVTPRRRAVRSGAQPTPALPEHAQ